jgi:hypothetical protein
MHYSAWWDSERERLFSFLSSFPNGSKVPLMILFWPNEFMSLDDFKRDSVELLNLPSILFGAGGIITAIDVIAPSDMLAEFNGNTAVERLKNAVVWLANSSEPLPIMRAEVMRGIYYYEQYILTLLIFFREFLDVLELHTADTIRSSCQRIMERVPTGMFGKNPIVCFFCY